MLNDIFFINFFNSFHLHLFPVLLGFSLSADKVGVFTEALTAREFVNPRDRQYGKHLEGQEKGHLHLHLRGGFLATKGDKKDTAL